MPVVSKSNRVLRSQSRDKLRDPVATSTGSQSVSTGAVADGESSSDATDRLPSRPECQLPATRTVPEHNKTSAIPSASTTFIHLSGSSGSHMAPAYSSEASESVAVVESKSHASAAAENNDSCSLHKSRESLRLGETVNNAEGNSQQKSVETPASQSASDMSPGVLRSDTQRPPSDSMSIFDDMKLPYSSFEEAMAGGANQSSSSQSHNQILPFDWLQSFASTVPMTSVCMKCGESHMTSTCVSSVSAPKKSRSTYDISNAAATNFGTPSAVASVASDTTARTSSVTFNGSHCVGPQTSARYLAAAADVSAGGAPRRVSTTLTSGSGTGSSASGTLLYSRELPGVAHVQQTISSAADNKSSYGLLNPKTLTETNVEGQSTHDVKAGGGGYQQSSSLLSQLEDTQHPLSSDTNQSISGENSHRTDAPTAVASKFPTLYSLLIAPKSSPLSQGIFASHPPPATASVPVAQLPDPTIYAQLPLAGAVSGSGGGGRGVQLTPLQPKPLDSSRISCGSYSLGVCCADCRARGWQVCRLPPIDTILPPRNQTSESSVAMGSVGTQMSVAPVLPNLSQAPAPLQAMTQQTLPISPASERNVMVAASKETAENPTSRHIDPLPLGGMSSSQTLPQPQAMEQQTLLTGVEPERSEAN